MSWNFMQVEMVAADHLIRPMVGPGGMTREQARAEIARLLDGDPRLAPIAASWRQGPRDDTVYAGPLIWCVYEHPDGEDPRRAALVWLEDLAATMRTAGADVQVAQFPSVG